jgi:biopolymer transport protein ExbD
MSKFEKKNKKGIGRINTASLPDIVFMLLFFFMTTTVMREVELKIQVTQPEATEGKKLEKKSLVSFIYIGEPLPSLQGKFGTEPKIQLNDTFKETGDIRDFIAQERDAMNENDRNKMMVSIKADRDIYMGIVSSVKQELRKASALKISYSSVQVDRISRY